MAAVNKPQIKTESFGENIFQAQNHFDANPSAVTLHSYPTFSASLATIYHQMRMIKVQLAFQRRLGTQALWYGRRQKGSNC